MIIRRFFPRTFLGYFAIPIKSCLFVCEIILQINFHRVSHSHFLSTNRAQPNRLSMSTVVFYIHLHQGTFTRFFFVSSTLDKLSHGDSRNFSSYLSNFASPTKPTKRFETSPKDDRRIIYILMSRREKSNQ